MIAPRTHNLSQTINQDLKFLKNKNKKKRSLLKIKSVMEKNFIAANSVEKCWGMVTLDAMPKRKSFGADFVVVIDVSASMNVDQKLYFVKRSLRFLLERLGEQHRVSLITFNHDVNVICDLLLCNETNKGEILELVHSLEASGSTNISDALLSAAEVLNRRENCERLSSVMLITDGLCNRGLTGEETVAALTDISLPEGCVCNTFGFGEEHDSKSLHTIALNTRGVYYYIEKPDMIQSVFNQSVTNILETVARNVVVELRGQDGARIIALHVPHPVEEQKKAKDYDVNVGLISSEEKKAIIFKLSLRRLNSYCNQPVIHARVKYSDMGGAQCHEDLLISITRGHETPKQHIPLTLDHHINRYTAAKIINEAIELSDQLHFREAREKLEKIIDVISSSASGTIPESRMLISELERCIEGMRDIVSFQKGIHSAHALSSYYLMEKKCSYSVNTSDIVLHGEGYL